MTTNDARWELSTNEPVTKPVLVTRLRLRKEDSSGFTFDECATRLMILVNQQDEILAPITVGDFRGDGGIAPPWREILVRPLMLVEGMRLSLTVGKKLPLVFEREVTDVTREEAIRWFTENSRTKRYPARWYGTAETESMKAKVDDLIALAKREGLRPHFVAMTDGTGPDLCCRACESGDTARGPFNAQLLTKRDDDEKTLFFAFPIVCGVCAEDQPLLEELIEEMWDRGRGIEPDSPYEPEGFREEPPSGEVDELEDTAT